MKNRNKNARLADPYGHEALFEASRRRALKCPSMTARQIEDTLRVLGVAYEPQYRLGTSLYALDFYLPQERVGVIVEARPNEYRRRDAHIRKRRLCEALGIEPLMVGQDNDWQWTRAVVEAVVPNQPAAKAA